MKKTILILLSLLSALSAYSQENSSVTISATECNWFDTGVDLLKGDQLQIEQTSGSWTCDKLNQKLVDANGHTDEVSSGLAAYAHYKTVKSSCFGVLLARVDAHILSAGKKYTNDNFPYSGRLYLKINDEGCGDNGGAVTLKITRSQGADISRGLTAYYSFEKNVNDISGNGNNGTAYGAPSYVITGRSGDLGGYAIDFDGVDDYVQIPNAYAFNTASMTVAFWVKPKSFVGVGNDAMIDKGFTSHTSPHYQFHFGITGEKYTAAYAGRFQFTFGNASYNTPTYFWKPGQWYYILLSYDDKAQRFAIFIDNQEMYKANINVDLKDYGKDVFLGRCGNVKYYTPVIIDELRFYNRAVSAVEREMLFKK